MIREIVQGIAIVCILSYYKCRSQRATAKHTP